MHILTQYVMTSALTSNRCPYTSSDRKAAQKDTSSKPATISSPVPDVYYATQWLRTTIPKAFSNSMCVAVVVIGPQHDKPYTQHQLKGSLLCTADGPSMDMNCTASLDMN